MRGKGEEEGDKTIQWEGGRREKGKIIQRKGGGEGRKTISLAT